MNTELLDRIATWLEAGAPHETGFAFNMDHLISDRNDGWSDGRFYDGRDDSGVPEECGTCCCIAGAALQFSSDKGLLTRNDIEPFAYCFEDSNDFGRAADKLGLDHDIAEKLFFPPEDLSYDEITPAEAAHTIRNLIATGEVDWSHVRKSI